MGGVTAKTIDEAAIMAVLARIPDPEIPVLTITDLGIVRGFASDPPRVMISPTYTGCWDRPFHRARTRSCRRGRLR
jgi:ring-1,2-phenylacetyl-CoA epoxidase subunit PaaD